MDSIAAAGQRALDEALRLFALDVIDPPASLHTVQAEHSRGVINDILTATGWRWEVPYKGDHQIEWCGLFAGACWHAAGLDPKWLATYFASTYRIDTWGRYQTFDPKHPNQKPATGPYRMVVNLTQESSDVPFPPMPGDILMIGDGTPPMGDHITIVENYNPVTKVFVTVSGNGVGLGPDGRRRQGIVRSTAHVGGRGYCARRLVRPSASDLA